MPSQTTAWEDRVKKHLETWPASMMDSINKRNFERKSPPWNLLAPSFEAGPFIPCTPRPVKAAGLLRHLSRQCTQNPQWHLRELDSSTHIEGDTVVVYTNVAVEGRVPDVVSYTTFRTEFQTVRGQWMVTAVRGLGGEHV